MKNVTCLLFILLCPLVFSAEKPNIVFILSDDIGTGDIGCYYKPTRATTPNIDKLAKQGMRFTQAYSPGSVCNPTRYALLTGYYPCRGPIKSGEVKSSTPLKASSSLTIGLDMLTLPGLLKQQGYRTAHMGKWHLGYGEDGIKNWAGEIKPGPLEIGFDYHLGLPTNHNDNFKTYVENHHLLWLKDDVKELSVKPTKDDLVDIRYDDEVDSTLTAKAIEFIRENHDKPFFVYLALVATHTHVTPNVKFRGTSEIGQLGDYINELDYHVGEIVALLDELGLADNTVLFFSSDNGGQKEDHYTAGINLDLRSTANDVAEKSKTAKKDAKEKYGHRTNGDFRGYKADIYEGGFRIPFIVRWPGHIAAGSESDQVITLADTLATVAGLTGQNLPEKAGGDSFDFSPVLLGKGVDGPIRKTTILQSSVGRGLYAIRMGDWKLALKGKTKWMDNKAELSNSFELYNLAEDPSETTDLSKKYPDRALEMRNRCQEIMDAGRSR